jgi:hypothetical protein
MDNSPIHKPTLPGVRTLTKDIGDDKDGIEFHDTHLTTPTQGVELNHAKHEQESGLAGKQLFDVERAYNNEEVQVGTIVTDKRKSKKSIGYVLKSAFSEWWGNTQQSVKDSTDKLEFLKPKEVPKVEVAESRTSIIHEAAQYAKQAPRDDHAIVVEKIRTLSHDAETMTGKPFVIKPQQPAPVPTWNTPTAREEVQDDHDEDMSPAPEEMPEEEVVAEEPMVVSEPEPEPKPVPHVEEAGKRMSLASYAEEKVKKDSHIPAFSVSPAIQRAPVPQKPVAPKETGNTWSHYQKPREELDMRGLIADTVTKHLETEELPSEPVRPPQALRPSPMPPPPAVRVIPTPPPAPEPEPEPEPIAEPVEVPPQRIDEVYEIPASPRKIELRPAVSQSGKRPSHALRNLLFTSVAVIGTGLGIFAALMLTNENTDPTPSIPGSITLPAFLVTDLQEAIPLGTTRAAFLTALRTKVESAPSGVTHIYPVVTTAGESIPASTEEVMSLLAPEAEGSFVRALNKQLMFGSVGEGDATPYLILQSANFDVAFAGMLEWERTMSKDLAPLFGEPVTKTLMLGTPANVTGATFIDALNSNRSIRILRDETGEERIVYAFVNNNLILITTTTSALADLIERIR